MAVKLGWHPSEVDRSEEEALCFEVAGEDLNLRPPGYESQRADSADL